MGLFDYLFPRPRGTASIARERLKIVLAHERASRDAPEFLPGLQKELLEVVGRYVEIRDDTIRVNVGKSGETSTLEINIEIDGAKLKLSGIGGAAIPKTVAAMPPPARAASQSAKSG
jgi:cell division topological specificity factor